MTNPTRRDLGLPLAEMQSPNAEIVNWRKPLKNGGIQFHIAYGNEKMIGSIAPASKADGLQAICEKAWGVSLGEPEWKAASS